MLFAYLDPGTGSLVLQMSVAGLLGGLYIVKSFWHQLIRKVHGRE